MKRLPIFLVIFLTALFPLACQKTYSLGPLPASSVNPTNSPTFTSTPSSCANGGVVTTLAGSGLTAATNGTGTGASFYYPWGVAVDSSGNVYVADYFNQLIRKITPGGVVTTLAGSAGVAGAANGTGTSASFTYPAAVAADSSGNVYVADSYNHLIRKITPGGVVTTLAGGGVCCGVDATGTAASFYYPEGVAVDLSGNLYVADTFDSLIRKITPGGVVTTVAGSGSIGSTNATGTAASFYYPSGIAVDPQGNLYVADYGNSLIRKITSGGVVTTLAGQAGVVGAANGAGTAASFSYPTQVAVDSSGNVYVADQSNNLIRKITSGGVVTTLAGSVAGGSVNGTGTAASFYYPYGVAVDNLCGVYVGDEGNNLIRKIQ